MLMQIDDQYECNKVPGCHWDVYSQGICTNNSLIPERIKASVSLPCLGLYSNQTFSEDDVIKQFNDLLMNDIPSLNKTMMQLSMVQDNTLIGRQIKVVLQGRVTSLPVSEIWRNIQQLIEGRQNVSVNGIGYHIMVHPVTYQQFTNMYISLTVDGFDADSLIQDHPLDGREEIRHAVIEVAKSYLRPQIVKSIGDFKFIMDEVTFSVDSSYDNSIDLRSEYDILQKAVTNGKVNVTVFDQAYDVKYVFFIGSFDHLCPRRCDEGTQSTCSIIPGCDWSNTGQCLSDVVFPERKTVNVVLPCIDIRKLSDPEKNYLLSKTTQYFTKYLKTKTLSTVVTSVHHQKDSPNHIVINLQATSRSPPLSVLYKDTEQWLKDKTLDLSFNNYTLLGRSSNDFTSISVALEFSNINFTELSIYKRMDWIKEISSRLKLILSDGISVDNEWLTLNYSIFDIRKSNNISYHIDLDKDLEKIQTFINLGGLTFHSQSTPITPHNILTNGNIDCHICNLTTQICKMERKCFLQGKWDVKFCNAIKNPDKFTYEVLLPCNQTQTLTVDEKKESEKILYNKVLKLLHPAGQHIINSVHIQQKGVTIKLQTSPLYPYLERYAETLQQQVDFRTGFNFGPQNKTTVLVPRHAEDFTNVEITLDFGSIDFDAIVNSGLASYSQISSLLNRKINFFLLGEIVQTYQVRTIEKDYIMFSLKKRYDSQIELSREITKLKNLVDAGVFDIDINYIRPVTATRMSVQGTFDELCDNLAAQSTGPVIYTLPTVASNASIHQIPVAMIPVPSILVLYNRSTASIPSLQTVIDTMYVDVCFIEMKKSPVTMESFSWNTCSFNTPLKDNTIKTERSNPDYIGPVQWTIIGVGGIFILALALWAIQGIHEMSKKNKSEESAPQNCSIEDTE
ncbi:unnamed protein product [Mytilus coruscus]|uniref:Uncharacterized protein n=1 Tax=Mytilus coruscus TaxID=42192 RepID=A0A6J8AB19_MYTCO|nr:unnamed protein product [Mytilus coruscus]